MLSEMFDSKETQLKIMRTYFITAVRDAEVFNFL